MATDIKHMPATEAPDIENMRCAIVSAEWNAHINDHMANQALEYFQKKGVEAEIFHVPGAIELTFAASQLIESSLFDAIIVFGTVIRGGTPHFDYVCQSVTQGTTALNADTDTPVIFGVLTVDNEQQAIDRAFGPVGQKGLECAEAAIKMVTFRRYVIDM